MTEGLKLKCIAYACVDGTVYGLGADVDCPACRGRGWVPFPANPSGEELSALRKIATAIFDEMSVSDGLEYHVAERFARAALSAMREPSLAIREHLEGKQGVDFIKGWHALVDSVLGEATA